MRARSAAATGSALAGPALPNISDPHTGKQLNPPIALPLNHSPAWKDLFPVEVPDRPWRGVYILRLAHNHEARGTCPDLFDVPCPFLVSAVVGIVYEFLLV